MSNYNNHVARWLCFRPYLLVYLWTLVSDVSKVINDGREVIIYPRGQLLISMKTCKEAAYKYRLTFNFCAFHLIINSMINKR